METSPLAGVEHMLSQMREAVRTASALSPGGLPGPVPTQAQDGFAAELGRTLQKVSDAQNAAAAQARAFQAGEPGVSLPDVMIELQKASLAFQTTLQVRNRLVAAYQEIASMPV